MSLCFASIHFIIALKKTSNAILFSPLCPQNNTLSVFTHTKTNIVTLPLETEASKASSLCVYIWLAIVFQSLWVREDNAVFQKLTIKHSWALVITHIWCQADCNVKATTLYSETTRLRSGDSVPAAV